MSETVVTIHFRGHDERVESAWWNDPLSIQFDADGEIITTGGDLPPRGDKLIGLSRVDVHVDEVGMRIGGPPTQFDPENWVNARDILDADPAEAAEWAGWFPAFMSGCGEWIYTGSGAVDRVEVTVR